MKKPLVAGVSLVATPVVPEERASGRSIGIGPILQYAGKLGGRDISADVKWLHEVDTKNRLSGDMIWLNFSLTL